MVDPRQPRFGQAITGAVLAVSFILDWAPALPSVAAVLGAAALIGPRANVYASLWRGLARTLRVRPPDELEEAGPPRFANGVGFAVLTAATAALYGFEAPTVAWALALVLSGLALLAAATGLCVGCELFVLLRRAATRGRIPRRRVTPVGDRAA